MSYDVFAQAPFKREVHPAGGELSTTCSGATITPDRQQTLAGGWEEGEKARKETVGVDSKGRPHGNFPGENCSAHLGQDLGQVLQHISAVRLTVVVQVQLGGKSWISTELQHRAGK